MVAELPCLEVGGAIGPGRRLQQQIILAKKLAQPPPLLAQQSISEAAILAETEVSDWWARTRVVFLTLAMIVFIIPTLIFIMDVFIIKRIAGVLLLFTISLLLLR